MTSENYTTSVTQSRVQILSHSCSRAHIISIPQHLYWLPVRANMFPICFKYLRPYSLVFMDVSLGDSGSWIVDLRMNIRPSSSTGVLFALVYNNIVPLSLAVVTRGDKHAVSSSRLSNTIDHVLTHKSTSTRVKLCSVVASSAPEPGSILGRCLCGDSGLYHVMLP